MIKDKLGIWDEGEKRKDGRKQRRKKKQGRCLEGKQQSGKGSKVVRRRLGGQRKVG